MLFRLATRTRRRCLSLGRLGYTLLLLATCLFCQHLTALIALNVSHGIVADVSYELMVDIGAALAAVVLVADEDLASFICASLFSVAPMIRIICISTLIAAMAATCLAPGIVGLGQLHNDTF